MIFPSSDISKSLKNLGLNKSDTVMIHGDAGVAAQYIWDNSNDPVSEFIKCLIAYFENGTVIVPTFTYSATKGEVFKPEEAPSQVGLFSEKFRQIKGVVRSHHPIFSVGCIGEKAKYFANSRLTDCFGDQTLFDKLYNKDVKLIALGCGLERLTFVHYIEQALNVPYRFFKEFNGSIKLGSTLENLVVRYFVRNLDINTELDFSNLEKEAISNKKMTKTSIGRFPVRLITAQDFFKIAKNLLKDDLYALIKDSK